MESMIWEIASAIGLGLLAYIQRKRNAEAKREHAHHRSEIATLHEKV